MSSRGSWLAVCATLCWVSACESEVTLHLLKQPIDSTSGEAGEGGNPSIDQAGAGGDSDASTAGVPSVGEAGGPPAPCEKLGTEVCNGGDDDCNGQIDEGCAYTVAWKRGPDSGGALGHATGGFEFHEPCPYGSVLTGLRVGMGKWLNQVSAICRQIELHGAQKSDEAFSVTLGARHTPSLAPASSMDDKNKVSDFVCPDGLILAGVDGTTAPEEAHYTRAIRITCAPPIVDDVSGDWMLDTDGTQQETVGPIVCTTCSTMPAYNYSTTIEPSHVASGLFGAVGLWVDRVGFNASSGSVIAK